MPHTHDGPLHLARMAAYYKALTEGQILPRWTGELNYGYGMPLFNFIYHVPYLVAVVPIALGAGLVLSFKLMLFVSFLLSGLFIYMFAEQFFEDRNKALITTALYQFAPFHLIDMVVRGDIGESFAFTFLPLVLFTIVRLFKNEKLSLVPTGIATALLIASHNSISLVFFGAITLFILWFAPNKEKRVRGFMGLGLGLALSAFYWLPAVIERKYTYGDLFMKDMYKSHFAPLWYFFVPNFTNSVKLQIGGIAASFGFVQIIVFLMSLWLMLRAKLSPYTKHIVWYALFLMLSALFIMQPVSSPLWEHIALLRIFQFPWRLLTVVVFALSLIGGAILARPSVSKLLVGSIMIVTLLSTVVYWSPPLGFDTVKENDFWNYPLNTTYSGETDLIWSAGPARAYPKAPFEIIEGKGKIQDPVKKQTKHAYTVIADTPVRVADNTQYFPGWRVYADGDKVPVEFQDQNWRGIITFHLSPGAHHILVTFGESPIRTIAEIITVTTLIGIGFSMLLPRLKKP